MNRFYIRCVCELASGLCLCLHVSRYESLFTQTARGMRANEMNK